MLKHLYIKDYVIIDELSIDFTSGMSVFTGETGAVKSIIIDAIDLLCGSRLTTNVVYPQAEKALIEGVFILDSEIEKEILTQAGFDLTDEYVLSREITKDAKSTMRLNYRVITQNFAKELLNNIIDIHNQHETQYLLNNKTHRNLLDRFINDQSLIDEVKSKYDHYHKLDMDLKSKLNADFNEDDIEFLTYQKNEIENANLVDGEFETLTQRQKQIVAFEKINNNLQQAINCINNQEGALEQLYIASKYLGELEEDEVLTTLNQRLKDNYYELEEISSQLDDYLHNLTYDENELNSIQDRLFLLGKLKRKYGDSYDLIQERYQTICDRLNMIANRQEYIDKATRDVAKALDIYHEYAIKLSELRREKALILSDMIKAQLNDLQLSNTKFDILFNHIAPSMYGNENVEFLISTNAGQPLGPLSKIASGGELSRIMLGLKTIFNDLQGIKTIIFDEIDAGVSGSIATAIGVKMHQLSTKAQVFAVTHLAQVAACSDQHYFVAKKSTTDKTTSTLTLLNNEERIKELAMIASGKISEASLLAAKELLENNQSAVRQDETQ